MYEIYYWGLQSDIKSAIPWISEITKPYNFPHDLHLKFLKRYHPIISLSKLYIEELSL